MDLDGKMVNGAIEPQSLESPSKVICLTEEPMRQLRTPLWPYTLRNTGIHTHIEVYSVLGVPYVLLVHSDLHVV